LIRAGDVISDRSVAVQLIPADPPEQVKAELFSILEQAAPGAGFVVGITENVPLNVRDDSIPAILEGLAERGECPLNGS